METTSSAESQEIIRIENSSTESDANVLVPINTGTDEANTNKDNKETSDLNVINPNVGNINVENPNVENLHVEDAIVEDPIEDSGNVSVDIDKSSVDLINISNDKREQYRSDACYHGMKRTLISFIVILGIGALYQIITIVYGSYCIDCKPKTGTFQSRVSAGNDIYTSDAFLLVISSIIVFTAIVLLCCDLMRTRWWMSFYGMIMIPLAIISLVSHFYIVGGILVMVSIMMFVGGIWSFYKANQEGDNPEEII